jgi:ABC-type Fe3+-hydroxamate transport system substrate-binding protein
MQVFRDDLGRELTFRWPPKRVVSLVPSDTYSMFALGAGDRLVGRTRFCVEPAGPVDAISIVGGTKDIDVDRVLATEPDLVLANKEENTQAAVEMLVQKGIPVWVSFPRRFEDGVALLAKFARIFKRDADPAVKALIADAYKALNKNLDGKTRRRTFVPIWREPLMTMNKDTHGSDMLARKGLDNVFEHRLRKYPLGADLGLKVAWSEDALANRDRRYPRVTLEEVCALEPELVLLPDEPFAFSDADAAWFKDALQSGVEVAHVSGKDLFWYGAWAVSADARLWYT